VGQRASLPAAKWARHACGAGSQRTPIDSRNCCCRQCSPKGGKGKRPASCPKEAEANEHFSVMKTASLKALGDQATAAFPWTRPTTRSRPEVADQAANQVKAVSSRTTLTSRSFVVIAPPPSAKPDSERVFHLLVQGKDSPRACCDGKNHRDGPP
jgi:hypothetical protein